MPNSDKPLFSQHEHALEKAYEVCPECGSEIVIKNSKSGKFFGCASYPTCNFTRPVIEHERVEDQVLVGTQCPECQHELAVKQGRYGMFIGCTNYPECHHIEHDEVSDSVEVSCPSCKKGQLIERLSRFGKAFYACDSYPKCKYAVNHQPVEGTCQKCGYGLLLKRNMAAGEKLQCAQKKCSHFQK
jgi:putative DNA topoisomerase